MRARTLRRRHVLDIWPGFVDALTSLILVMVFVLLLFVVGQYVLMDALSAKDQTLENLHRLLGEVTRDVTGLRGARSALESKVQNLGRENEMLKSTESILKIRVQEMEAQAGLLESEKLGFLSQKAQSDKDLAGLQVRIDGILSDLHARDERITALDRELKLISETRLSELQQYRSEFFGKLKEALSGREDIRISGDRFILPSDVLFKSGSADLGPEAEARLDGLASTIRELEKRIPPKIEWVIRVDGHTDKTPIQSPAFPSNWELSSARAITLVKYLVSRGVDPQHLSANGLGPYHPIDVGDSPEALARNRRIEFQLTNR